MSANLQEITSEVDFNTATQSGVVLVDFFATWCQPCKMQVPILEQVAAEIGEKAKIIKIDVDKLSDVAAKFKVSSIPTLILFKNGEAIDQMVGVQQAATLTATLKSALDNAVG